jgi:ABC-type lipoprotein release transport system permease subunit
VTFGLAAGTVAAFFATRLLQGLLYGVESSDPLTFIAVVPLLGTVSLFASYVPAARATRVDPADTMRI